jgi:segregation and condensation protein B
MTSKAQRIENESMDQQLITRIVEAALLAASQPLTIAQLHALFVGDAFDDQVQASEIATALQELQAACADRGVELVEVASGWRFQVKADVHPWVSRLWAERQTKYTRATLETLALIAYRQPITRGEIEQIRGVAVNSNIIKALEEREWIRVVGHRDVPGRPELLGTTRGFLDYFGLQRLDQLPPLSELKDFGELEPQLALGDVAVAAPVAGDADSESDSESDSDSQADSSDADAAASDGIPQHDDGEDEAFSAADAPEQDEDE